MHGTFGSRRLPLRSGTLEGYIDGWEGGTVRGWVWDPLHPQRRVKIQLFIDGGFCGTFAASLPRPDLQASGRGDGLYGFSIPAQNVFAAAASGHPRVQVVSDAPEIWTIPFAPHIRMPARRRGFARPRLRRLPATTRELVAMLTSAEPFPKKVAVIDRLGARMPDAFSADYILLAIEFLRVELVAVAAPPATSWGGVLRAWWRQRLIRGQIRRLSALAEAAAATQTLLNAASTGAPGLSGQTAP